MANIRDTLTDEQLTWLTDNVYRWHNKPNSIITKYSGWTQIGWLYLLDDTSPSVLFITINADGSITTSKQSIVDETSFWYRLYVGEHSGQTIYYKNFGNNQVDSYETIGLPEMKEDRVKYEFITIDQTAWRWTDMLDLINRLKVLGVEIFDLANSALRSLAYTWDLELDNRYISPLLNSWLKSNIDIQPIAEYFYQTYSMKWNKLYEALQIEYEPLENYSMTEHEEHEYDITDKLTGSTETTDQIYAYDSEDPSNQAKSKTEPDTENKRDDDGERELTRSGNIGVMTSQQMLESEFEFRKKLLLNIIRDDIVNELTIEIFDL